jgi:hypothetical protein
MRRLLAGGLLAVVLIVPAPAAPDKAKPAPDADAADIADKLLERTDMERFEQVSFRTAIEVLQEKLGYTILVDHKSVLAVMGQDGANRQALEEQLITLPSMKKVRLGTVLREILDQVGADYYIEADHIKVTSPMVKEVVMGPRRTLPDLRPSADEGNENMPDPGTQVRLTPTVTAAFKDVPLGDALKVVSQRTGRTVVVNPDAGADAKAQISVALTNAPFETAVSVLAEAAGLRAFRTGNAAVLVTPDRAAKIDAAGQGMGNGLCLPPGLFAADSDRVRALEEQVKALTAQLEALKKK